VKLKLPQHLTFVYAYIHREEINICFIRIFFSLKSFNSFFVEKKNKHKIHATVTHNTHKNSFVASILGHHML